MSRTKHQLVLPLEEITTGSFTLRLYPDSDYVEYVIKEGVIYDEAVARQTKSILESVHPDRKTYLLVTSNGFFRVGKKVRKLGASKEFSSHLAAVAFYST